MSAVQTIQADYRNPQHAEALIVLLDGYAQDPMGGGQGLAVDVKHHLVERLAQLPHALSILAFVDEKPVGLANCFEGFSTFAAQPLINIHDLVVLPGYRRQGIGRRILSHIEALAKMRGCCKVTLEVLQGNEQARGLYAKVGYQPYALRADTGPAQFLQKFLD